MTIDQLSEQALRYQELQLWVTATAIFLGPLAGVLFTLWFQRRKERHDAKQTLFFALLAERKHLPLSREAATAMNQIDIVFNDRPAIRSLWQKYYSLLSGPTVTEEQAHTWLELLSAISTDLGYKNLSQTDLDKFYVPQGHIDLIRDERQSAEQWRRVLTNTEKFIVEARKNEEQAAQGGTEAP